MANLPALSFLWPKMLWLLLLVPLLAFATWRLGRRRGLAVRYPALDVLTAGARPSALRRHLPGVLMLLGLCALIVAVARPRALMMLPSRLENVVLAMDMSGSMRADDIKPSRIYAAQQAAKVFVDEQPSNVSMSVVAVAGAAAVVQSPTRKREDVIAAINRLEPQRGTALGTGLIIALATLLPNAGIDVERFLNGGPARAGASAGGTARDGDGAAVVPGSYPSGAIVLLSDGQNNTGPDAIKAAQVAAEHGVRIFTVGIGTPEGATLSADGWSMRVRLDEDVLKKVADMTGAQYYPAADAAQLKQVYRSLSARLAFDKRDVVEITALFTALGALLAVCSGLLSLWWFGRVQ